MKKDTNNTHGLRQAVMDPISKQHHNWVDADYKDMHRVFATALPDALILHDQEKILFMNPAAMTLLEYENGEDYNHHSLDNLVHADHLDDLKKAFQELIEEPSLIVSNREEKFITASGNVIDVEVASSSLQFGGFAAICSVIRDITYRKKRELEILKLSRVVEQSPNSILITDFHGNIEYVNPTFETITGYHSDEVLGKTPDILNSGGQNEDFYTSLFDTVYSGKQWIGEVQNKRKNGELYWESAMITPIRDANDNMIGFAAENRDITIRKMMESKLIQRNTDLSETVKKLKETQSQLIQQERLAGIGQLAAGIAHEINNPLGFITSNFKILSDYLSDFRNLMDAYDELIKHIHENDLDSAKDKLKTITEISENIDFDYMKEDVSDLIDDSIDGLERLEKIVRGLRLFSRVDQMNELESYDLNEGIKTTLLVCKNEIKYSADVQTNFGNLPSIAARGGEINQVLLNILINAAHAIKSDESKDFGLIKIHTYIEDTFVHLEIEDNGTGISQENLDKIFDPFFTTKPVGQGTGLGLGIAHEIINKHNGQIWAESECEKGTTFHIKLPIDQETTESKGKEDIKNEL